MKERSQRVMISQLETDSILFYSCMAAWFIAGIFVILAVTASIYEVAMHLEYYNRPRLQLRVVRILCMVPIYAIDSWASLRFKDAAFYIDPVRECYEAFVIYNFFMYLVVYLEDEYGDVIAYYSTKEQVPHLWPVSKILKPWKMGDEFFWETKRGVLSYVIARPLMTAVSVVTNITGKYCDGEFKAHCAYPYVAFINNCSQMWALYCLVMLYHATCHELAPIRPLPKFIAIKAVVFLTFWQGLAINLAARLGLIHPADWSTYDTDDVAAGLQNFLVCLEMFAAAIGHAHAFPPRDYMDPSRPPMGFMNNLRIMFDVTDVASDIQGVVVDTIAETQENINQVGRKARDTAVDLVTRPFNLMGMSTKSFAERQRSGSRSGLTSWNSLSDNDGLNEGRALLLRERERSPLRFGLEMKTGDGNNHGASAAAKSDTGSLNDHPP